MKRTGRAAPAIAAMAMLLGSCQPPSCGDEFTACYAPTQDTAAMAAIASDWAEANGLSVALCEDVARAAASPADGCAVQHVVRGGDLGATHCDVVTVGCCSHRTEAYVHGVASGAGLPGTQSVSGEVSPGVPGDPYALPWQVSLRCDDAAVPCIAWGTLKADGSLDVALRLDRLDPATETTHALTRAGSAVCP